MFTAHFFNDEGRSIGSYEGFASYELALAYCRSEFDWDANIDNYYVEKVDSE